MGKYESRASYCATCNFWTGPRKPNSGRWEVEFNDSAEGECAGGASDRRKCKGNDHCHGWQLWGALQVDSTSSLFTNKSNESNSSYSSSRSNVNSGTTTKKMHWIYFLLIGWWLGLTLACLIIPLFIKGLVKKSFGYW